MCTEVHRARKLWERSQPLEAVLYLTTSGSVHSGSLDTEVVHFVSLFNCVLCVWVYVCGIVCVCVSVCGVRGGYSV